MRGGIQGDHAAHAVAKENDTGRVCAETLCVGRVAQIGEGALRVFDRVLEAECPGRSPAAAVIEVEDVPALAPDGLREIEVLLIAGKAMQQKDRAMGPGACRFVEQRVERGAMAGELKSFHGRGRGLVLWRVRGDGRWRLSGQCGRKQKSCKKN